MRLGTAIISMPQVLKLRLREASFVKEHAVALGFEARFVWLLETALLTTMLYVVLTFFSSTKGERAAFSCCQGCSKNTFKFNATSK